VQAGPEALQRGQGTRGRLLRRRRVLRHQPQRRRLGSICHRHLLQEGADLLPRGPSRSLWGAATCVLLPSRHTVLRHRRSVLQRDEDLRARRVSLQAGPHRPVRQALLRPEAAEVLRRRGGQALRSLAHGLHVRSR
jgi:hypothetical protein